MSLSRAAITNTEMEALGLVRQRLEHRVTVEELILYGSAIRGDRDDESDLDLLVLVTSPLNRALRQQVTDVVFDVNLEYGTNISALTVDAEHWRSAHPSLLLIREAIIEEGTSVWVRETRPASDGRLRPRASARHRRLSQPNRGNHP